MTNNIFFIIICFYDGTLKGNEKLQVWVLFSKKRENEEKHGKNFSDDKLNQTNYILYICNQTAQVPRFDEENREPCENHGLSRNCNHQKGFATNVHCPGDGKDGKMVKVRIPAFAD